MMAKYTCEELKKMAKDFLWHNEGRDIRCMGVFVGIAQKTGMEPQQALIAIQKLADANCE